MNVYMNGRTDTSWTRQQRAIHSQLNDARWDGICDTFFFFFSLISNVKEEK